MLNQALKSWSDIERAKLCLTVEKCVWHQTQEKNWDLWVFTKALSKFNRNARILDVGCVGNPLLANLKSMGFNDLDGLDFGVKEVYSNGIRYWHGDLTRTSFAYESFDAITSLSVIEHGVEPEAYVREMSRILKPGGLLLTSTDYWTEPVSVRGVSKKKRFGLPWKVQSPDDVQEIVNMARRWGLEPTGPIDFSVQNKVVRWEGKEYTFINFALKKKGAP